MAQYARPDSDISVSTQSGGFRWWVGNGVSQTNYYQAIDEASADDTDFIRFKNNDSEVGVEWAKFTLSDISQPSDLSTLSIRTRVNNSTDTLYVRLYEDSSLIKSYTTGTGSLRNVDQALSEAEAGNITDYSDLILWLGIDTDGTGTSRVYQAYLEAGDASGGTNEQRLLLGVG